MKSVKSQEKTLLLIGLVLSTLIRSCGYAPQIALKEAFKDYFLIGVAVNDLQVAGYDRRSIPLIEKHFNSLTPENVLKWEKVQPEPGLYNFGPADTFVDFGRQKGMFLVGHTLVWNQQTPDWVFQDANGNPADREILLQRMQEHIESVVGHYKGRMIASHNHRLAFFRPEEVGNFISPRGVVSHK